MARELNTLNTRLVIKGDATEPTSCNVETRVVNGDMAEEPKSHEIGSPDFNQTVSAVCTDAIDEVKTTEGIS